MLKVNFHGKTQALKKQRAPHQKKQTKTKKVVIATCLLAISEHFPGLVQYIHRKEEKPILTS